MSFLPTFIALAGSVSLLFGAAPSNVYVGETFKIPIYATSNNLPTLGTDAVVTFDPKVLEAVKISSGRIYPFYPENLEDFDNTKGAVSFSGSVGLGNPIAVNDLFGSIYFKAKNKGRTQISFSWKEKSTTGSHIVPLIGGIDLLTSHPEAVTINIREANAHETILSLLKEILSFDYLRF